MPTCMNYDNTGSSACQLVLESACFLGKVDNAEIFGTAIFSTSMPVGGNTCYKTSQWMFSGIKMFAISKK